MKAKLGALVTEAKGSLGGHTIQNSRGGVQIRNKPIPTGKPSDDQYFIRSNNSILHKAWHDLTPSQRQTWNDYAIVHRIQTKGSDKHTLSGQAFFLKAQGKRLVLDLPMLSNPSEYKPEYFGPELVVNGTFNSDSDWTKYGNWTIHTGRAWNPGNETKRIEQTSGLEVGESYRIRFDLYHSDIQIRLLISRQLNPPQWSGTPGIWSWYPAGSYDFTSTYLVDRNYNCIYSLVGNAALSIDNFSIRKWL